MSGNKKEAMFAKLVAQQAKPVQDEAVAVNEPMAEESPPSPAPPPPVRTKAATGKPKAEKTKGKRDDPDYCQANAYVPKKLRRAVDKALLDIDDLDYSTLVTELLRKWVKSRGVSE
jgi:hypothetical protein